MHEDIVAYRNDQAAAQEEPQQWDPQVPAPQHFNIFIMVFSYQPPKKRKEIKLFTRESSQQAKKNEKYFWVFF